MELIKSLRKRTHPLWEVVKIKNDPKMGIVAKVKLQYGTTNWIRVKTDYIWIGPGEKKIRYRGDVTELPTRYTLIKIRVPELEKKKEVRKQVRKETKKQYKTMKRW